MKTAVKLPILHFLLNAPYLLFIFYLLTILLPFTNQQRNAVETVMISNCNFRQMCTNVVNLMTNFSGNVTSILSHQIAEANLQTLKKIKKTGPVHT